MSGCDHTDFVAAVDIHRLYEAIEAEDVPDSLAIEVRAHCADCLKPVRFEGPIGAAIGSAASPRVSIDGCELRAAGHMGENRTPHLGFTLSSSEPS